MTYAPNKVHGKSFVIISGDVQRINALERMLFFAGASVQAATTAERGINFIRNVRPDIVIIDDTVSDLDMPQIAATIAADWLIKKIPLIIIAEDSRRALYTNAFAELPFHLLSQTDFDVMNVVLQIETILQKITGGDAAAVFDFSESDAQIEKAGVVATNLRLLVIEDDPLLRNLLSIRLQKSAIQHQFCHSGTDAMSHVLSYKPTVIILDLMLPGKAGMDVLKEIRGHEEYKKLPVIIFSNKDDDEERRRAQELDVHDFLVKATTDLGDLIAKIIKIGK